MAPLFGDEQPFPRPIRQGMDAMDPEREEGRVFRTVGPVVGLVRPLLDARPPLGCFDEWIIVIDQFDNDPTNRLHLAHSQAVERFLDIEPYG